MSRIFSKTIFAVAVILVAASASLSAQNKEKWHLPDSVDFRKTWSFYAGGGVGSFYGMRGPKDQYSHDRSYLSPTADIGVMYHPLRWFRLGLDFGYTYLQGADDGSLWEFTSTPNYTLDGHTGTYELNKVRVQNKNFTHEASADLTFGINLVEIWKKRHNPWFHIWATVGAGYMHGWNHYTTSWAIDEVLKDVSDDHDNQYTHSYLTSSSVDNQSDAFYVPGALSIEFDVIPQLSIGVQGRAKYFPFETMHTPTLLWDAGIVVRYNLLKGYMTKSDEIAHLNDDLKMYESSLARAKQKNKSLSGENEELNSRILALQQTIDEMSAEPEPEPEPVVLPPEPEGLFVVQIYAFKYWPHASDDAIFMGDNPKIYKNGKLRRYVLLSPGVKYSEAKAKLEEVRPKYFDAFIATIDENGTVTRYE